MKVRTNPFAVKYYQINESDKVMILLFLETHTTVVNSTIWFTYLIANIHSIIQRIQLLSDIWHLVSGWTVSFIFISSLLQYMYVCYLNLICTTKIYPTYQVHPTIHFFRFVGSFGIHKFHELSQMKIWIYVN